MGRDPLNIMAHVNMHMQQTQMDQWSVLKRGERRGQKVSISYESNGCYIINVGVM